MPALLPLLLPLPLAQAPSTAVPAIKIPRVFCMAILIIISNSMCSTQYSCNLGFEKMKYYETRKQTARTPSLYGTTVIDVRPLRSMSGAADRVKAPA
ncbi:MAG TPA: hypothetical protein VH165_36530 [Kofleriaceae bacterium]|nr:hypothetical protein [Kofleriaceae bacterium]